MRPAAPVRVPGADDGRRFSGTMAEQPTPVPYPPSDERDVLVLDFVVGKRGAAVRTPVDQIFSAIKQTGFMQTLKRRADGAGEAVV